MHHFYIFHLFISAIIMIILHALHWIMSQETNNTQINMILSRVIEAGYGLWVWNCVSWNYLLVLSDYFFLITYAVLILILRPSFLLRKSMLLSWGKHLISCRQMATEIMPTSPKECTKQKIVKASLQILACYYASH
jgi:hypothetical protein